MNSLMTPVSCIPTFKCQAKWKCQQKKKGREDERRQDAGTCTGRQNAEKGSRYLPIPAPFEDRRSSHAGVSVVDERETGAS